MPYPLVNSYRLFIEACCIHLKGISCHALLVCWLDPVIGGSKLRRNVGKYLYQYLTRKKKTWIFSSTAVRTWNVSVGKCLALQFFEQKYSRVPPVRDPFLDLVFRLWGLDDYVRSYSRTPLIRTLVIRIGLPLGVNLSRIPQDYLTWYLPVIGSSGHECLSVVSCQVEVSATSWSLVQRSPTDCGTSCVI